MLHCDSLKMCESSGIDSKDIKWENFGRFQALGFDLSLGIIVMAYAGAGPLDFTMSNPAMPLSILWTCFHLGAVGGYMGRLQRMGKPIHVPRAVPIFFFTLLVIVISIAIGLLYRDLANNFAPMLATVEAVVFTGTVTCALCHTAWNGGRFNAPLPTEKPIPIVEKENNHPPAVVAPRIEAPRIEQPRYQDNSHYPIFSYASQGRYYQSVQAVPPRQVPRTPCNRRGWWLTLLVVAVHVSLLAATFVHPGMDAWPFQLTVFYAPLVARLHFYAVDLGFSEIEDVKLDMHTTLFFVQFGVGFVFQVLGMMTLMWYLQGNWISNTDVATAWSVTVLLWSLAVWPWILVYGARPITAEFRSDYQLSGALIYLIFAILSLIFAFPESQYNLQRSVVLVGVLFAGLLGSWYIGGPDGSDAQNLILTAFLSYLVALCFATMIFHDMWSPLAQIYGLSIVFFSVPIILWIANSCKKQQQEQEGERENPHHPHVNPNAPPVVISVEHKSVRTDA